MSRIYFYISTICTLIKSSLFKRSRKKDIVGCFVFVTSWLKISNDRSVFFLGV